MTNQQALQVYQTYVEAWKPVSDEQRKNILGEVFAENVEYRSTSAARRRPSRTWNASRGSTPAPTSQSKTSPHIMRLPCSYGCSSCPAERSP